MKMLDDYFKCKYAIHEYFGYEENWVEIPIEDTRDYVWMVNDDQVSFAETIDDFSGGNHYTDEIYTQRYLKKYVYRGEDYTMICVDTHTDGNKFLRIFDNKKEIEYNEEMLEF